MKSKVLHIASWYPNPWDDVEGNFVREQIRVFSKMVPGEVIVVQVREGRRRWPRLRTCELDAGARGYFLLVPGLRGRAIELLSTLLLVGALLRKRAWRFDVFHFHIAYPLLMQSHLWRWIFRKPVVITEHWSAYHFKFNLPEGARALRRLRRIFHQDAPVFAVSHALLADIRNFAQRDDFKGFVLPNVVPLHGASESERDVPVLFAVNRWVAVKNPLPMLAGLNRAAESGLRFKLVLGGYGDLLEEMKSFVEDSALRERTRFAGKLTKNEIAAELAGSDGYLFSSDYETFSIACAEALGAGVPLIGPHIPAIAEYAGSDDWVEVLARTPEAWQDAVSRFVASWQRGQWDKNAIASRANARFSENRLRAEYRAVMEELGLGLSE